MLYVKSVGDGTNYTDSEEAHVNVSFGGSTEPETVTYTLTFPDDNNGNNGVGAYTRSWTAKIDTNSWTISNFNNNNWNSWTYIKCGSKSQASVATISTDWAIAEAIRKVVVTIDSVTTSNVNSTYLEMATDSQFNEVIDKVSVNISTGDLVYAITNPANNCYYRLTYDCKQGSKNGFIQISKVVYTNE